MPLGKESRCLLNVIDHGMNIGQAVEAGRIHHQWLPETLLLESPLDTTVAEKLQSFGHATAKRDKQAVSQAARFTSKGLEAASDARKHGRAAGF